MERRSLESTGSREAYPAFRALVESGDLEKRSRLAIEGLSHCKFCPRRCGANRLSGEAGHCRVGLHARVSGHFPHLGEEPCLSGWRGSGTIFLSGCNLSCAFCQNWETSQECEGVDVSASGLAEMMLELQDAGCHNVNWVTPEHVVPQVLDALSIAVRDGLRLPIVYNTSAYDSEESLALLDGVVDIYMPDFKCWEPAVASRLLGAEDYPERARRAIREMHRQVGDLQVDAQGIARRGLLVRHLVLPGGLAGTAQVAAWLAREVSPDTLVNIMGQYRPAGSVILDASRRAPGATDDFSDVSRPLFTQEFRAALQEARDAGLRRFSP